MLVYTSFPLILICSITPFGNQMFLLFIQPRDRGCVLGHNMCLPGALCSIPTNLICNLTSFRKKNVLIFDPPKGSRMHVKTEYVLACCCIRGCVLRQYMFLHGALCSIPIILTCNKHTSHEIDLSPPVKYFTDHSKAVLLLWIFYVVFFCLTFAMLLYASIYMCLVVA